MGILLIMLSAALCGIYDYHHMEIFAKERWGFFQKYINQPRTPCENTLRAVFGTLDPERLDLCIQGIFRNVFGIFPPKEKQYSIDGKTVRGENSVHIVTAMIPENYLSVYQKMVGDKENEIPVVREILAMLSLENAVVTFDALHCQKETLAQVVDRKGDYVVQVKKNQKLLHEDIVGLFELESIVFEREITVEKGHGRTEKRICEVLPDEYVTPDYFEGWAGLRKIFRIRREVEKKGKISIETSYYISSKNASAADLMSYTRKHWKIESMHWILDKVMGEDGGFLRDKNAQECMNRLRKFAVTIMKNYIETAKPKEKSISSNMFSCLLSTQNLEKVLHFFFTVFLLQFCYLD